MLSRYKKLLKFIKYSDPMTHVFFFVNKTKRLKLTKKKI